MPTLTIELPDAVYRALIRHSPSDLTQQLRLALACQWYAQGEISQGKGAEIAGLSRAEFIDECAKRYIPVGQYSPDEVLEELRRA